MATTSRFCYFLISLISFSQTSCFVDGFTPLLSSGPSKTSRLMSSASSTPPPSRRDVFKTTGSAAVAAAAALISPQAAIARSITEISAANKANESYQGVYYDPKHPNGYRILQAVKGSDGSATMSLSDGAPKGEEPKTFRDIPVRIDNGVELTFDFGFKNGPKNIKGTLSPDKQSIVFEDGNTWKKNYYQYDGIYKVTTGGSSLPKDAYRIIRKNGPEILLEMNDTGNPKDSYFVDGSVGSLYSIPTSPLTFYFGGKGNGASSSDYSIFDAMQDFQRGNALPTENKPTTVVGQFSLQDKNTVFHYGTITFPDKTVWTRI